MIRSMTGFGREHILVDGREIIAEIRSVNHRYYEFNARLPRQYMYLEERLKSLVHQKISRGKVEISISIYNVEGKEMDISINPMVVKGYISALRGMCDEYHILDNLKLSHILSIPDAFNIVKPEADEEEIWSAVKTAAEGAVEKFVLMREAEGEKLYQDVLSRLDFIEQKVNEIEKLAPITVEEYRKKLTERLNEVLESKGIDENRILLEAAIFAEKTAIDEETIRLKSHINQYRQMLNSSDAVGRKLDFLTQEMNREVNTIGSKCQNINVTKLVVDLKSEIEKVREQIQNIE